MAQTEVEKLFETTSEPNVMEQSLNASPVVEEQPVIKDEELGEPKRRRESRLMQRLQDEREANIAMSAKLEALSEARKLQAESEPSEYLKKVQRIYGTDSPEAQAATDLLTEALTGLETRATERALEAIREEQRLARETQRNEERTLESFVEHIEDTYNVTFTPEVQKAYFQLMEKLSPKDSEGNITAYADPDATWELFQERINKSKDTRAKDLASRAMSSGSSSPTDSGLQDDAARAILREAGIIN